MARATLEHCPCQVHCTSTNLTNTLHYTDKAQVAKSITLRTAIRLSDYAVQNITTLGQFRDAMLIRPKPKKTAQKLKISATFDNLPNVSIIDRRVTPIDREKKIGRWKLIEQELLDRGLPVTGQNTKVKQSIVI